MLGWQFLFFSIITERFNACKACESTHLAQFFDQHNLLDDTCVAIRHTDGCNLKIIGAWCVFRMAQYLPFRYFQVEGPDVFIVLRAMLLLFDPGPKHFIAVGAQLQALKGLSTPQECNIWCP